MGVGLVRVFIVVGGGGGSYSYVYGYIVFLFALAGTIMLFLFESNAERVRFASAICSVRYYEAAVVGGGGV